MFHSHIYIHNTYIFILYNYKLESLRNGNPEFEVLRLDLGCVTTDP